MKMTKRLLAVVLAGVLVLSTLTGCGGSSTGKDMYDAYIKLLGPGAKEAFTHSEKLDRRAEAVLKVIDTAVSAEDSSITWENAIRDPIENESSGELMDGDGFVDIGSDNPIRAAVFGQNEPADYEIYIHLTEMTRDDPEMLICMLMDHKNANQGYAEKGCPDTNIPEDTKWKVGAAKFKASNGKTYALLIKLLAV